MDKDLQDQFLRAIMRFKKTEMHFPPDCDINMSEFIIMMKLLGNCTGSGKNVYVSDMKNGLFISKSAVSQLLNSLEGKGYIKRDIDTVDRRKISVILTQSGRDTMNRMKEFFDNLLFETISRLGEEDAQQLVVLFNRLVDRMEDIKRENLPPDDKEMIVH
ncbi:MAG: MarR family winged helix-turn-helix transcriptional regulator [Saccharofermentanales bacterium]